MKFQIENGTTVGTAEWREAGGVKVDVAEPEERRFLERYFSTPYSALGGPIDCPEMQLEAPDSSQQTFERAMNRLAGRAYKVRRVDEGSPRAYDHDRRTA